MSLIIIEFMSYLQHERIEMTERTTYNIKQEKKMRLE